MIQRSESFSSWEGMHCPSTPRESAGLASSETNPTLGTLGTGAKACSHFFKTISQKSLFKCADLSLKLLRFLSLVLVFGLGLI
jgi:hypothetical protein